MKHDTLVLRAPNPGTDKDELFDLASKTFSGGGGYAGFLKWARNGYFDNGFYDWNASRIGIKDGKIVSHFGVWDLSIKVGNAKFRTAAIGAVATDNDFRKQGLMARTAPAALEASKIAGYDVSILYGISNFYHRFGFFDSWNEFEYGISIDDLPDAKNKIKTSKPKQSDADQFSRLYNKIYGKFSGSAVRPSYPYFGLGGWGTRTEMAVLRDSKGHANGYIMYKSSHHEVEVWEAIGPNDAVLSVVKKIAASKVAHKITFPNLPHQHPLATQLRSLPCDYISHYRPSGSAMVCSVNLLQSTIKLASDMEKNLADSKFAGWRGSLAISDHQNSALITVANGKIGVTAIKTAKEVKSAKNLFDGGISMGRYLINSGNPEDTMLAHKPKTRGLGKDLARVLFPNRHTIIGMWDHF